MSALSSRFPVYTWDDTQAASGYNGNSRMVSIKAAEECLSSLSFKSAYPACTWWLLFPNALLTSVVWNANSLVRVGTTDRLCQCLLGNLGRSYKVNNVYLLLCFCSHLVSISFEEEMPSCSAEEGTCQVYWLDFFHTRAALPLGHRDTSETKKGPGSHRVLYWAWSPRTVSMLPSFSKPIPRGEPEHDFMVLWKWILMYMYPRNIFSRHTVGEGFGSRRHRSSWDYGTRPVIYKSTNHIFLWT